jgi:hypothetical protein
VPGTVASFLDTSTFLDISTAHPNHTRVHRLTAGRDDDLLVGVLDDRKWLECNRNRRLGVGSPP